MMDDAGSFADVWNQAFKTYREQTDRELQNDTQLKKLQSTTDLLNEIESRSKEFGSFRNKHKKLCSALSRCLKPLELLGNALQNAVTSAPFASMVFASVLHLITVGNTYARFRQN
jgi:hypothetical protein